MILEGWLGPLSTQGMRLPYVSTLGAVAQREDKTATTLGGGGFTHYAPTTPRKWDVELQGLRRDEIAALTRMYALRQRFAWIDPYARVTNALSPEAALCDPGSAFWGSGATAMYKAGGVVTAADGSAFTASGVLALTPGQNGALIATSTASCWPTFTEPYVFSVYVKPYDAALPVTLQYSASPVLERPTNVMLPAGAFTRISFRDDKGAGRQAGWRKMYVHLGNAAAFTGAQLTYGPPGSPLISWMPGQASERAQMESMPVAVNQVWANRADQVRGDIKLTLIDLGA